MVLVTGEVTVDESSLTGETIPIVKSPLPYTHVHAETYHSEKHRAHTLYGGSSIMQVKASGDHDSVCIAIVVATGFSSTRGELFRSILFPKPVDFKFFKDSYQFMLILGIVALVAFLNRLIDGYGIESPYG